MVPFVNLKSIQFFSGSFYIAETNPTLTIFVAAVSFAIFIVLIVAFILFCRKGKKKLKPADVIPDVSEFCFNLWRERKLCIAYDTPGYSIGACMTITKHLMFMYFLQNDKNLNEKEYKSCDRSTNLCETKLDIRRDFTQTFSPLDGNQTTQLHDASSYNGCGGSGGVPLAGAVLTDYRYCLCFQLRCVLNTSYTYLTVE